MSWSKMTWDTNSGSNLHHYIGCDAAEYMEEVYGNETYDTDDDSIDQDLRVEDKELRGNVRKLCLGDLLPTDEDEVIVLPLEPKMKKFVNTNEAIYQVCPRWEQSGYDKAPSSTAVDVDGTTQAGDSGSQSTSNKLNTPQKHPMRNVEDFCDQWHDSTFFAGRQFRVNNMSAPTKGDGPTGFSLDVRQLEEGTGLVKAQFETSFGVVDGKKDEEILSALTSHVLTNATTGLAAVSTEVPQSQVDVFGRWIACRPTEVSRETSKDKPLNQDDPYEKTCMICFSMNDDDNEIPTRCGHVVCHDCWKNYLDVKVRNAEKILLKCPKENCKATMDFLDSAIVFDPAESEDVVLWRRLVENELKHFAIHDCQGFYCPNSFCSDLIVLFPGTRNDNERLQGIVEKGQRLMICQRCTQPICSKCHKSAHPGMSCDQDKTAEKVFKSSDEAAINLAFITKFTKPCPECSYGIIKVDGCNHMRCQHCQYYFCWECGGYGNDCNAYKCSNPGNKDWWKESDHTGDAKVTSSLQTELRSLENDADRYKAHLRDLRLFRAQEKRLKSLQRSFQSFVEQKLNSHGKNLPYREMMLVKGVRDSLHLQYAIVMAMRWKLFYQETMHYKRHKRIDAVLDELCLLGSVSLEKLDPSLKDNRRSNGHNIKRRQKTKAVNHDQDLFFTLMKQANKTEIDMMDAKGLRWKSTIVIRRMLSTVICGSGRAKRKKQSFENVRLSTTPTAVCNMSLPPPFDVEPLNTRQPRIKPAWKKKDDDDETAGEEVISWKKTKARTHRQRVYTLDQQHGT